MQYGAHGTKDAKMVKINKFIVFIIAVLGLTVPCGIVNAADDWDAVREECTRNEARCEMKYRGKTLTFDVKFHSATTPMYDGDIRVALFYTGERHESWFDLLNCHDVSLEQAAKYDYDTPVTVVGEYEGFSALTGSLILKNCKF